MVMERTRNLKGPSSEKPSSDYASIATSSDNVEYCRLYLARSHREYTCPLHNEATQNLIISHRRVKLVDLPPRNLTRPASRSRRCSGGATPNTYCPGKRSRKRSGRTTPNAIVKRTVVPGAVAKPPRRERQLL